MSGALILSARFEEKAQGFFQSVRDTHFPRDLNIVPAHLTLFHKLPGDEHDAVTHAIAKRTGDLEPLPARVIDVRFFGTGGGFLIDCPGLVELRASLVGDFGPWLGAQDRQRHKPHVTYQNKVTKAAATRAYEQVLADFVPFGTKVVALDLWWYRRHWDEAGTFSLGG